MKDFFEWLVEVVGNFERQQNRWGVVALFDGNNCLSRNANGLCKLFLGDFLFGAKFVDAVSYCICHVNGILADEYVGAMMKMGV